MRCFVAVNVSDATRRRLVLAQEALRRAGADVRWDRESNLHLTLKFLGEIGEEQAAGLRELLAAEAPRHAAFDLEVRGLGTFPERGAPRVVWAGCAGDVNPLRGLASSLELAAGQVGIPREERPYSPHLTIGRVKSSRNAKPLLEEVGRHKDAELGRERVDSFDLMRSTPGPDGPVYTSLASFGLRVS